MKIIHSSGELYDLPSDADLEFTRYNPFFNELGELSNPITLPATAKNRRLMGYPHRTEQRKKREDIDVIIDCGAVQFPARQVVHSCTASGIDCTFYPNDGGLYCKLGDKTLQEVFAPQIFEWATMASAVAFCNNLQAGEDERFAVFPVDVDGFADDTTRQVNQCVYPHGGDLYGMEAHTEVVEETDDDTRTVNLPQGFGISPFCRLHWVLRVIAEFFGYTLDAYFLSEPGFKNIVILNNNFDSILDKKMKVADLLPSMTVKEFLAAVKSRFCAEFYPDEQRHILYFKLFRDIETAGYTDFTAFLAAAPETTFAEYKAIQLTAEQVSGDDELKPFLEYVTRLANVNDYRYSSLVAEDPRQVKFFRQDSGYLMQKVLDGVTFETRARSSASLSYIPLDDDLEIKEIELPGLQPFVKIVDTIYDYRTDDKSLYLGAGRMVKSFIKFSDGEKIDLSDSSLDFMLAYDSSCCGSCSYDGTTEYPFSLMPGGDKGLFERFYRYLDHLYRNALDTVKVSLMLPVPQRATLSPTAKIMLRNQLYIISRMTYTLDPAKPVEMELLSLAECQPSTTAPAIKWAQPGEHSWRIIRHATANGIQNDALLELYTGVKSLTPVPEAVFIEPPTARDYENYPVDGDELAHAATYEAVLYNTATKEEQAVTLEVGLQVV